MIDGLTWNCQASLIDPTFVSDRPQHNGVCIYLSSVYEPGANTILHPTRYFRQIARFEPGVEIAVCGLTAPPLEERMPKRRGAILSLAMPGKSLASLIGSACAPLGSEARAPASRCPSAARLHFSCSACASPISTPASEEGSSVTPSCNSRLLCSPRRTAQVVDTSAERAPSRPAEGRERAVPSSARRRGRRRP